MAGANGISFLQKMKNIMLDLETLGTGNNALITQIGACYFAPLTGEIGRELTVNLDIKESLKLGLDVDSKSIKFWLNQPREAVTFLKDSVSIDTALRLFRAFAYECTAVWSHAIFDFVLLVNLYERFGMESPIQFRQCHDIRTLMWLAEVEREKLERVNAHDALSDCKHQVVYCTKAFQKIFGQKGTGK